MKEHLIRLKNGDVFSVYANEFAFDEQFVIFGISGEFIKVINIDSLESIEFRGEK